MKVSMVIPCAPKDFYKLCNVLNFTASCSKKPDEVILGISQIHMFQQDELEKVQKLGPTLFNEFKITGVVDKHWPGPNRQRASEVATGDIIIYQDADDLPHFQRVEHISRFFEEMDIVHLNSAYFHSAFTYEHRVNYEDVKTVESNTIYKRYFPSGDLKECTKVTWSYGDNLGFKFPLIHVGATSIRRSVLEKIQWKDVKDLTLCDDQGFKHRTEDYEFCMSLLHTFNKSLLIDAPLYYYYT